MKKEDFFLGITGSVLEEVMFIHPSDFVSPAQPVDKQEQVLGDMSTWEKALYTLLNEKMERLRSSMEGVMDKVKVQDILGNIDRSQDGFKHFVFEGSSDDVAGLIQLSEDAGIIKTLLFSTIRSRFQLTPGISMGVRRGFKAVIAKSSKPSCPDCKLKEVCDRLNAQPDCSLN